MLDMTHRITGEPDIPNTGYGRDEETGKLSQSYPYYGFLFFYNTYNSRAVNCALNSHTTYYEDKTTAEYLYNYEGDRTAKGLSVTTKNGKANGIELHIAGILRLKEGLSYGCLTSGLYMTEKLVEDYIAVNMQSKIAEDLHKQSNVIKELQKMQAEISGMLPTEEGYMNKVTAMTMYMMQNMHYFKRMTAALSDYYIEYKGETMTGYMLYGDSALRAVGGKDNPNVIQVYTDNFDAKESILDYLDEWNDTHAKEEQVKYTDTVGMMMTMMQTMLNAITYVLVAFTSISLVVSSVMIGIITYVSVVERVKEIGVLRSLGARKKDIRNLFNAETFIIGLASGLIGVTVTYLASLGINAILGALTGIYTLASLPITSAILMVCVSVGLTLVSGLIPAGAAAKKDPVVALRTE